MIKKQKIKFVTITFILLAISIACTGCGIVYKDMYIVEDDYKTVMTEYGLFGFPKARKSTPSGLIPIYRKCEIILPIEANVKSNNQIK